jgi:hypothetical protein
MVLGTTPNMAPPSSLKNPVLIVKSSISQKSVVDKAGFKSMTDRLCGLILRT